MKYLRNICTIAVIVIVYGCVSPTKLADSWTGSPVEELIFAWGPPGKSAVLSDGRRVLIWQHIQSGSSLSCTIRVNTNSSNVITKMSPENYGGCNYPDSLRPARE
jgi:hypothetical protein